ncbi:Uncharacterised protein [Staphylococcus gallinarum]|nr:Uncharacterised protein [Staphylococcus gallinarum]
MVSKALAQRIDKQCKQYKAERDTLIDDIAVLRANEKRLEQIRDIKDSALKGADIKIKALERENEKLKRENRRKYYSVNERNKYYQELWNKTEEYRTRAENAMELAERANCEVLRLEVVESNYNALTQHIRQKAEANPNVDRYIALVNYIDRLERGEDD